MRVEYRIVMTMTFNDEASRDDAYIKIKNAIVAVKPTLPTYRAAALAKDDYNVPEPTSESI